ncbi:MAG: hypothetical protein ACOCVM_01245 [Desulfovibrionaceae bacterium]
MGFLYRKFYILLFLLWLAGVTLVVSSTLWGDMSGVLRSLGVNGTVTESAGEALGVGQSFFQKISQLVGADEQSASRQVADIGAGPDEDYDVFGEQDAAQGNVTAPDKAEPAIPPGTIPARKGAPEAQAEAKPAPKPAPKQAAEPAPRQAPRQAAEPASARTGAAATSTDQGPGEVTAVRFENGDARFTAWVEASKPVPRYTYFWLASPRKLVVDVRGTWRAKVKLVHRFQAGMMEKVVLGEHADRLRMVMYFRDPAAPEGRRPSFEITEQGLTFIVRAASSDADRSEPRPARSAKQ